MSIKQCCCLCCTSCCEYKTLQNEAGDCNEIYEITVKYFDPMLLTEENKKCGQFVMVLCHDCWYHINDFHEFQQTVIMTRNSLGKSTETQQIETDIKKENFETDKTIWLDEKKNTGDSANDNDDDQIFEVGSKNNYKIENYDSPLAHNDEDDDEKPLIILTKSHSKSIEPRTNEKLNVKILDISKFSQKTKSRRGRKPKNSVKDQKNSDNYLDDKQISQTKKTKLSDNKDASNFAEKGMESDNFIAEWKPELECDICCETSRSFQKLRHHFKEQHKTRGYIKCCERKFYRRYVLVDHIRLHLNPEMHKCDICGKPSSSQYNLKLHKKIMHENTEQFECDICHKMFNQKPTLERHMLTHVKGSKDFPCKECGKAYVLEVQLKSHIKTVHNVDRVCDQCGKTIHGVAALKKHLMEHAGIKRPKFPCDKCGAELNSRNSLRRHMASFHHDGSTIYVCGICGKVAASENALLTHKKHVHEEERKHKCTYCDKAFKRPKVLREHIATHTGQDLYQCPHCPQTFKVNANMHHHRKKMHPIEWEEGRKNRLQLPKVNINQVKNQIVI